MKLQPQKANKQVNFVKGLIWSKTTMSEETPCRLYEKRGHTCNRMTTTVKSSKSAQGHKQELSSLVSTTVSDNNWLIMYYVSLFFCTWLVCVLSLFLVSFPPVFVVMNYQLAQLNPLLDDLIRSNIHVLSSVFFFCEPRGREPSRWHTCSTWGTRKT